MEEHNITPEVPERVLAFLERAFMTNDDLPWGTWQVAWADGPPGTEPTGLWTIHAVPPEAVN
jgi:hypothetical protein